MFDRFTDRAKKVMNLARQEARNLNHEYIGTEHILLGLVSEGAGVAANVLKNMGVDLAFIRVEVERLVKAGPAPLKLEQLPFTPRAKKVLEGAMEAAAEFGHNYIGTEHLLLGLAKEGEGIAAKILVNRGLRLDALKEEILEFLGAGEAASGEQGEEAETASSSRAGAEPAGSGAAETRAQSAAQVEPAASTGRGEPKSRTPALDAFGLDLTALAREGKLDPFAARDGLLDAVVRVLLRRTHPNPVLVGEPGTGKTALARGLALRMASGSVPDTLRGRRFLAIDLPRLIAGTKYRGQFEERVLAVVIEARRDPAILFLDDVHLLVDRQRLSGQDEHSAADVLAPALEEGLMCIGATTPEQWSACAARHAVLARRFQVVPVPEATQAEALSILRAARARLEEHHALRFDEGAVCAAIESAGRVVPGRRLPGAAVDVLDEAGALVAFERDREPPETGELAAEIERLEAAKVQAVRDQEFDRASALRDQAHELGKRRKAALESWRDEARRTRERRDRCVEARDVARLEANRSA